MFGQVKKAEFQAELVAGFNDLFKRTSYHAHTPDLLRLSRRPFQRVFIYDAMMKGHHHSRELEGFGEFQAVAFTLDPMELWCKNLGKLSYPMALKLKHHGVSNLPVKGELWKVHSDRLLNLDNAHMNGLQFRRVRVTLNIPTRRVVFLKERAVTHYRDPMKEPTYQSIITNNHVTNMQVTAWMYVGVPEYWEPLLDGGYTTTVCRKFNSDPKKSYYYFSPMEYDELK